jgi:hypothetical protein
MGNAEISKKHKEKGTHDFENFKKEYFRQIRNKINENLKELECYFDLNQLNSVYFLGELKNKPNWKEFLCINLENLLVKYKQKNVNYINTMLQSIDNLDDSYYYLYLNKMKTFVANQIDLIFNDNNNLKSDQIRIKKLNNKKIVFKKTLKYIFENLECHNHPINKIFQIIIFNFLRKYQEEFKEIEYLNSVNKNEEDPKYSKINKGDNSMNNTLKEFTEKDKTKFVKINQFYENSKDEMNHISIILKCTILKFYNIIEKPSSEFTYKIEKKVKDYLIQGDLLLFFQKLKYDAKNNLLKELNNKFLEFASIQPKDLGVFPYFSLDNKFRCDLVHFIKRTDNNNIRICYYEDILIPFSKTLNYLHEIDGAISLTSKLKIIRNLRDSIIEEIDSFWKDFSVKQNCLDADNLLSIFIYLIVKNGQSNLIVDLEILNDFMNNSLKSSRKGKFINKIGYFFWLLYSSINYIVNSLNSTQIKENQLEYSRIIEKEYCLK